MLTDDSEDSSHQIQSREVYHFLDEHFNIEELHQLCFDLGIDHEDLGHNLSQNALVREIVLYHERIDELPALETAAHNAVAERKAVTGEKQRHANLDITSQTCAVRVVILFGLVMIFGLGFLSIRTMSLATEDPAISNATMTAAEALQIAQNATSQVTSVATYPATSTPSTPLVHETSAIVGNQGTPTGPLLTATSRPITMNSPAPPTLPSTSTKTPSPPLPTITPVIGVQTLPDGIRDQVSSVRVSGGCALLYGSATSADEFLRVCEDVPLLPPEWANHTKQVDADCESGAGAINVTVYTDGDFQGDPWAISFCE